MVRVADIVHAFDRWAWHYDPEKHESFYYFNRLTGLRWVEGTTFELAKRFLPYDFRPLSSVSRSLDWPKELFYPNNADESDESDE